MSGPRLAWGPLMQQGTSVPIPAYDTLVVTFDTLRYWPGGELLGPDLVPYDFIYGAIGPIRWVDDAFASGPDLTPYDTLLQTSMDPDRYVPADELIPE